MKKIFACLAIVLTAAICAAQPPGIPIESPSATPEDFELAISVMKKTAEKSLKVEAWNDQKVVNSETKEEKKFGDLSGLEQRVMLLDMAFHFSQKTAMLQAAWDKELKKFDNPAYKAVPRAKIENQKQNPAVKGDVEIYHKQLLTLRKEYAVSFEKYVEKFVKDYSKEIDEKEAKLTLDQIRTFHDKQKLVERKKDK